MERVYRLSLTASYEEVRAGPCLTVGTCIVGTSSLTSTEGKVEKSKCGMEEGHAVDCFTGRLGAELEIRHDETDQGGGGSDTSYQLSHKRYGRRAVGAVGKVVFTPMEQDVQ